MVRVPLRRLAQQMTHMVTLEISFLLGVNVEILQSHTARVRVELPLCERNDVSVRPTDLGQVLCFCALERITWLQVHLTVRLRFYFDLDGQCQTASTFCRRIHFAGVVGCQLGCGPSCRSLIPRLAALEDDRAVVERVKLVRQLPLHLLLHPPRVNYELLIKLHVLLRVEVAVVHTAAVVCSG